jgi:hypothetical protein
MITTCTKDDVIRYVYEETSETENPLIEDALMSDTDLTTFFMDVLELRSLMNKIQRQPRESSMDRIMNYSRTYGQSATA